MDFLKLALFSYYICYLVIDSRILGWTSDAIVRLVPRARNMMSCYACFGFWVNMAVFAVSGLRWGDLVVSAGAGASVCYVLALAVDRLDCNG